MRKYLLLALVFFAALSTAPTINAVTDSIVTGPYRVSFNMELNQSEYKNITIDMPKATETLEGIKRTDYNIIIISANRTRFNESGINLSVFHEFNPSAMTSLLATGAMRIAMIGIREFEDAQQVSMAV